MTAKKFSRRPIIWLAVVGFMLAGRPTRAQSEDAPTTPSTQTERAAPVDTATTATLPTEGAGLRFNFQGVPLATVLDYLSREGGFIVIAAADVEGRVDVISHQPLTSDEAVALLDTVLNEKGYAAVRNGRVLTIVPRDEARTRDVPVKRGNDPDEIERSDQIITQIIPVRYANAKALVEDLQPLLPEYATLSANESSNAIVLTDTQTSVRRIAEIVRALDQSISEITALRVFNLRFADAKQTATLITDIYKERTGQGEGSDDDRRRQVFQRFFRGRGGDDNGGGGGGSDNSAALQAAAVVTAVADERTNSLVISAPEEMLPTIESLVVSLDRSANVMTDVRVFMLRHANCEEMAEMIQGIFGEESKAEASGRSVQQRFSRRGGNRGGNRGGGDVPAQEPSARSLTERTVLAVADTRTNSIVVSAVTEVMEQVEQVVEQLDRDPAKTKRVYVYSVNNANPELVSGMLSEMFAGETGSGTTTRSNSDSRASNTGGGGATRGTGGQANRAGTNENNARSR